MCVCVCSEVLETRLVETEKVTTGVQQQLALSEDGRGKAEMSLKSEQVAAQKHQHICNELKQTCEDYTGEINSLLKDLDEHTNTIKTLEEERDTLREQVEHHN